jgi:uncharacterized protein YndB with AHSA1/START domain
VTREFRHSLSIAAPPGAVLDAFFEHEALKTWWHARRSLCVARPLGSYAVEWEPTAWEDEILGRLGGTLRGTVIEFKPGQELFIADAYWLPPDGDPIGPMAIEATCSLHGTSTVLHLRQSGWEDQPRWNRYYDIIATGLTESLEELKTYVELWWGE